MKSIHSGTIMSEVGVELKYCEHCGGLFVRERSEGAYCSKCQSKVDELPTPRQKRTRLVLPVRPHTAVEDFPFEIDVDKTRDFEAGGAA